MQGFTGFGLGFIFGTRHSSEFGITRTSSGDRYTKELASYEDKTQKIEGADGALYFGSTLSKRDFPVSFAFEEMSEEQWESFNQWLGDGQIHDLIFDEEPYKVWSAKVSGKVQKKFLPFDKKNPASAGEAIYRGEGTITFTCFYPYARSLFNVREDYPDTQSDYPIFPVSTEKLSSFDYQEEVESKLIASEQEQLINAFGEEIVEHLDTTEDIPPQYPASDSMRFRIGNGFSNNFNDISLDFREAFPSNAEVGWKGRTAAYTIRNIGDVDLYPNIKRTYSGATYQIKINGALKMQINETKMGCNAGDYYIINHRSGIIEIYNSLGTKKKNIGNKGIVAGDFFTLPIGETTIEFSTAMNNSIQILYNYLYSV